MLSILNLKAFIVSFIYLQKLFISLPVKSTYKLLSLKATYKLSVISCKSYLLITIYNSYLLTTIYNSYKETRELDTTTKLKNGEPWVARKAKKSQSNEVSYAWCLFCVYSYIPNIRKRIIQDYFYHMKMENVTYTLHEV